MNVCFEDVFSCFNRVQQCVQTVQQAGPSVDHVRDPVVHPVEGQRGECAGRGLPPRAGLQPPTTTGHSRQQRFGVGATNKLFSINYLYCNICIAIYLLGMAKDSNNIAIYWI